MPIRKSIVTQLSEKYDDYWNSDPWECLLSWTPEVEPEGLRGEYFEVGDEDSPFLSETYLYNLLGKEDARTLLAMLRRCMESAGLKMHEVEAKVYEGIDWKD